MTNVTFQNEWDYRENVRYLQSATRTIIYVHYLFDETERCSRRRFYSFQKFLVFERILTILLLFAATCVFFCTII